MSKRVHTHKEVTGYLKPDQHKFIRGYARVYDMSESKVLGQAVNVLRSTTPASIRERIQANGGALPAEE